MNSSIFLSCCLYTFLLHGSARVLRVGKPTGQLVNRKTLLKCGNESLFDIRQNGRFACPGSEGMFLVTKVRKKSNATNVRVLFDPERTVKLDRATTISFRGPLNVDQRQKTSVSFYVKFDDTNDGQILYSDGDDDDDNYRFFVRLIDGRVTVTFDDGSSTTTCASEEVSRVGRWYHYSVQLDIFSRIDTNGKLGNPCRASEKFARTVTGFAVGSSVLFPSINGCLALLRFNGDDFIASDIDTCSKSGGNAQPNTTYDFGGRSLPGLPRGDRSFRLSPNRVGTTFDWPANADPDYQNTMFLSFYLKLKSTGDGLILYSKKRKDFLYVGVVNGRLNATFELGAGSVTAVGETAIVPSRWYRFDVSRIGVQARVDVNSHVGQWVVVKRRYTSLNIDGTFRLGNFGNMTSVDGCVGSLQLNGWYLDSKLSEGCRASTSASNSSRGFGDASLHLNGDRKMNLSNDSCAAFPISLSEAQASDPTTSSSLSFLVRLDEISDGQLFYSEYQSTWPTVSLEDGLIVVRFDDGRGDAVELVGSDRLLPNHLYRITLEREDQWVILTIGKFPPRYANVPKRFMSIEEFTVLKVGAGIGSRSVVGSIAILKVNNFQLIPSRSEECETAPNFDSDVVMTPSSPPPPSATVLGLQGESCTRFHAGNLRDATQSMNVEFYLKYRLERNSDNQILYYNSDDVQLSMSIDERDRLKCTFASPSRMVTVAHPLPMMANRWYHYRLEIQSGSARLLANFRNDESWKRLPAAFDTLYGEGGEFVIGGRPPLPNSFKGSLADVKINEMTVNFFRELSSCADMKTTDLMFERNVLKLTADDSKKFYRERTDPAEIFAHPTVAAPTTASIKFAAPTTEAEASTDPATTPGAAPTSIKFTTPTTEAASSTDPTTTTATNATADTPLTTKTSSKVLPTRTTAVSFAEETATANASFTTTTTFSVKSTTDQISTDDVSSTTAAVNLPTTTGTSPPSIDAALSAKTAATNAALTSINKLSSTTEIAPTAAATSPVKSMYDDATTADASFVDMYGEARTYDKKSNAAVTATNKGGAPTTSTIEGGSTVAPSTKIVAAPTLVVSEPVKWNAKSAATITASNSTVVPFYDVYGETLQQRKMEKLQTSEMHAKEGSSTRERALNPEQRRNKTPKNQSAENPTTNVDATTNKIALTAYACNKYRAPPEQEDRITVSFRFKTENRRGEILGYYSDSFDFYVKLSAQRVFVVFKTMGETSLQSADLYARGEWVYVKVEVHGSTARLNVNGQVDSWSRVDNWWRVGKGNDDRESGVYVGRIENGTSIEGDLANLYVNGKTLGRPVSCRKPLQSTVTTMATATQVGSAEPNVVIKYIMESFGRCSATCGNATKSRNVLCVETFDDGNTFLVDDARCPGTKPKEIVVCDSLPSCASTTLTPPTTTTVQATTDATTLAPTTVAPTTVAPTSTTTSTTGPATTAGPATTTTPMSTEGFVAGGAKTLNPEQRRNKTPKKVKTLKTEKGSSEKENNRDKISLTDYSCVKYAVPPVRDDNDVTVSFLFKTKYRQGEILGYYGDEFDFHVKLSVQRVFVIFKAEWRSILRSTELYPLGVWVDVKIEISASMARLTVDGRAERWSSVGSGDDHREAGLYVGRIEDGHSVDGDISGLCVNGQTLEGPTSCRKLKPPSTASTHDVFLATESVPSSTRNADVNLRSHSPVPNEQTFRLNGATGTAFRQSLEPTAYEDFRKYALLRFHLKLEDDSDGQILFASSNKNSDFLSAALKDGRLKLTIEAGSGEHYVVDESPLSTEVWYNVTMYRIGQTIGITVDERIVELTVKGVDTLDVDGLFRFGATEDLGSIRGCIGAFGFNGWKLKPNFLEMCSPSESADARTHAALHVFDAHQKSEAFARRSMGNFTKSAGLNIVTALMLFVITYNKILF